MAEKITIYQKPTCSTCRQTIKILKDEGVPFESIDYIIDTPNEAELHSIIKKLGIKPIELFRKKESLYKEMALDKANHSDTELIKILVENPILIERPIVIRGKKAVIARPPEKIHELF
jgi:arsenate reductase